SPPNEISQAHGFEHGFKTVAFHHSTRNCGSSLLAAAVTGTRRGGPPASRAQINRQIVRFGAAHPEEFEAPEELVFFARLSLRELRVLVATVDCVFTYDVVPSDLVYAAVQTKLTAAVPIVVS
ncbi:MAG TPA: hypothetical protein VF395_10190, partial [Polyangiaceae bacterium]